MSKEVKKDYIVRVYKDGDIINEIKLKNSKKKILLHKYDIQRFRPNEVYELHKVLERLHPKLQILSLPKESEIEIYEIQ